MGAAKLERNHDAHVKASDEEQSTLAIAVFLLLASVLYGTKPPRQSAISLIKVYKDVSKKKMKKNMKKPILLEKQRIIDYNVSVGSS